MPVEVNEIAVKSDANDKSSNKNSSGGNSSNDGASNVEVVKPCPDNEEHWIEIELRDEDGNPVPNEEFRVVLPSGEAVSGFLDDNGFQHVGPFEDAGNCEVSFPSLDESAVRAE